jgi:hypothetical protein
VASELFKLHCCHACLLNDSLTSTRSLRYPVQVTDFSAFRRGRSTHREPAIQNSLYTGTLARLSLDKCPCSLFEPEDSCCTKYPGEVSQAHVANANSHRPRAQRTHRFAIAATNNTDAVLDYTLLPVSSSPRTHNFAIDIDDGTIGCSLDH